MEDEEIIPVVDPLSQVEKRRVRGRRRTGGIGVGVELQPPLSAEPALKTGGFLSRLPPWEVVSLGGQVAGGGRGRMCASLLLRPSLEHHGSDWPVKQLSRRPSRVTRQNRPPPAGVRLVFLKHRLSHPLGFYLAY